MGQKFNVSLLDEVAVLLKKGYVPPGALGGAVSPMPGFPALPVGEAPMPMPAPMPAPMPGAMPEAMPELPPAPMPEEVIPEEPAPEGSGAEELTVEERLTRLEEQFIFLVQTIQDLFGAGIPPMGPVSPPMM